MTSRPQDRSGLRELASVFLRLGTIGFGGPVAHIAMMEEEVVRRRGWLPRETFLDLLAATNLIPGPNSTEMAIHIGRHRAGFPGLLVAGACFMLPAVVIVTALAWLYASFGTLPQVSVALYAVKPAIIAIVVQALWGFGRGAVKSLPLAILGLLALAANFCGVSELTVLGLAGAIAAAAGSLRRGPGDRARSLLASAGPFWLGIAGTTTAAAPFSMWTMFLVLLKIGSVLFGSGYVLLAFLRADFVARYGWLTEGQLLDAVAVGQVTPGPVFTTATFIGYLLGGPFGAAAATVAIFLPAFVFVGLSGPLVPALRKSRVAGAALDGVLVASLAVMAAVTWRLLSAALVDGTTAVIAVLAAILLVRFRLNSSWVVLGAGLVGAARFLLEKA